MKLTRIAVLGVAVGAGLIAAFMAMRLTTQAPAPAPAVTADAPAAPVVEPPTYVLVAAEDIPLGATLTADSVRWAEWPKNGISDRFIQQVDGEDQITPVVDSFARASFYAGEPISQAKLIRSDQGFMAAILPSGMRAVATQISPDTSAGGFILPNDRVDVVMTRPADPATTGGGNAYQTETILNNVRVLAIDQTIEDQDGQKVVVGQTATLELSPRQVQILTVAQRMADRLTLALRSITDSKATAADTDLDAVHLISGTKANGAVTVVKNGVPRDVSGIR